MPPVSPTYPGVYIEEIPSGNRTIVGVQTSITAFIGRTPAGALNEPQDCFNYADFERYFGGRSYQYPLSYAVEDFFLNGGSHAIVVRAFHQDATQPTLIIDSTAKFKLTGGVPIWAIGPGAWGNDLTIGFDYLGLRTAAATPSKSTLTVTLTTPATPVPADEAVTFTVTPTGGTASAPVTYKTKLGDSALAIANGLAAAFNGSTVPGLGAAVASPAANNTATVTLATSDTGTATATTFTVQPTGTKTVGLAATDFTGGADAKAKAATGTLAVAGAATTAGDVKYSVPMPNQTRPVIVTIPVLTTDTGADVAKKIAAEFTRVLAGTGGILKPVTLKDPTTLNLVAATPGVGANSTVLTLINAPAGLTLANATFAGGADSGYDTTLADTAAKKYAHYGLTGADLFNVTITYSPKGKLPVSERYTQVSLKGDDSPTRIDRVINPQSLLVAVNPKDAKGARLQAPFLDYTGVTIQNPGQPPASILAAGGADSDPLEPADLLGDELDRTAMYALEEVDLFNLMCIPPDQRVDEHSLADGSDGTGPFASVYAEAAEFCAKRRAMLICDPPRTWAAEAKKGQYSLIVPTDVGVTTEDGGRNSAVYFPFIYKADLEMNGKSELFAPSGSVAGQFAQTDLTRGVWKAPAGMETGLSGVTELDVKMTDDQNGELNPLGVNAIRYFPIIGPVIWGSRTLRGADVFSDDYKYVPVRRLTLYIEESLYRGTKWAVFEPNSDGLWSQLRLSVGTFMADLARQGAFYGYSVTCDKSTTLQSDIDRGIVNVVVAFAPVKPAEFVVLKIAQLAGQTPG